MASFLVKVYNIPSTSPFLIYMESANITTAEAEFLVNYPDASDPSLYTYTIQANDSSSVVSPNLKLQASDYTIPSNYSLVIHDEYEIGDGLELTISDNANMQID